MLFQVSFILEEEIMSSAEILAELQSKAESGHGSTSSAAEDAALFVRSQEVSDAEFSVPKDLKHSETQPKTPRF